MANPNLPQITHVPIQGRGKAAEAPQKQATHYSVRFQDRIRYSWMPAGQYFSLIPEQKTVANPL